MVPTPSFKLTEANIPAQWLCVTEVSGANNPSECDGNGGSDTYGDAAWLDGWWAENSGPGTVGTENYRLQTAWGKHNNHVNVIYVDGHVETHLVSQLTWGNFFGIFNVQMATRGTTGGVTLPFSKTWYGSISTNTLDSVTWSTAQE